MKVLIIGGVACGAKTAARLARVCPEAEITLLERGQDLSYANCGFPFYIGGEAPKLTGLTHMGFGAPRDAAYFDHYAFTQALTGHEAIRIDRAAKQVWAKVAATGEEKSFAYDKLVLATGASPIRPPLPGLSPVALENVFTLWTLRDAVAIHNALEKGNVKKAVVIGAGLVGSETAEMLKKHGLDVALIDALPYPLMALAGEEGGRMLASCLKRNGVAFYGGEKVSALVGEGRVSKVVTDKRELEADLVVVAIGVRPNLTLAKEAGLVLGEKALVVDEFMRTSDPDIYAGGDCVESRCIITGGLVWQPMGSVANRQGRVIADHIAGLSSTFGGVERTAIARLFDWTIGKTGLNPEEARNAGFQPVSMLVMASDIPGFMPGAAPVFIRLTVDEGSRKVLGALVLGPGRCDKRLDILVTAIKGELTVDALADVDTAYAPPFATAMDPVTHAANGLKNKLDGLVSGYTPNELRKKADAGEKFVILDVRTAAERDSFGTLPFETLHIPLGELKARHGEVPKDREVVILCRAGARAWTAYAMLRRFGFSNLATLEGGMTVWSFEA